MTDGVANVAYAATSTPLGYSVLLLLLLLEPILIDTSDRSLCGRNLIKGLSRLL